jgi:peptidoglycan hydrolase-like protein with peptidoglycan-binding domain
VLLDKGLIQTIPQAQMQLIALLRTEQQGPSYGDGTVEAVSLFQQKHRLQATGAVDAATAEAMNAFLKALGASRPDRDEVVFAVQGRVVSRDRAGVGDLRIVIVDRNVGQNQDVHLAEATTGDDGCFRVTFTLARLRDRHKERPDLQARVFAGETFLGASVVRYNASNRETLDVALSETAAVALPSELETLTSALAGVSPLKELLEVSLGHDDALHKRFAEIHATHRDDPTELWRAVRDTFGEGAEKRLRLDGQLGYLTRNNAPLMRKLHAASGQGGLTDTVQLAEQGYYQADRWQALLGDDAIPPEVPGTTYEERRARYAELLAAQVRLSFPTMVVA